jgi:cysteine-S-conjugate beta-lyase
LAISKTLKNHAKIKQVIYPGLEDHPQHQLAKEQMRGFGGIVTIELASKAAAEKFATSTEIFTLAESLGGVESLICHPVGMTHASVPEAKRLEFGLTDSILRLSVGIEDQEDLIQDILQALEKI